ncbi:YiiD C-terminal domain-containing protein [Viridibacterium curvum]|uniref:YiiD C-terminal domain-containing protein n=1 Tax=Viridibacterium curvum TaxID=1101404 RepID=A0ABP9R2H4_9RHOO
MNQQALLDYLYAHIPLSQAMGVTVQSLAQGSVTLAAPLAPNINHRGTAFGGSISTLATLAAWSLLRVGTDTLDPLPRLVIRRNTVDYSQPVAGDFTATAHAPGVEVWNRFLDTLAQRGRARITLSASVRSGDVLAATFVGDFVALRLV